MNKLAILILFCSIAQAATVSVGNIAIETSTSVYDALPVLDSSHVDFLEDSLFNATGYSQSIAFFDDNIMVSGNDLLLYKDTPAYEYVLEFEQPVPYNATVLLGMSIFLQDAEYTIAAAGDNLTLSRLEFEKGLMLEDGQPMLENSQPIEGTRVTFEGAEGSWEGLRISWTPTVNMNLRAGEAPFRDPMFGNLAIQFVADDVAPVISIASPQNNSEAAGSIEIDATTDTKATCTYILCLNDICASPIRLEHTGGTAHDHSIDGLSGGDYYLSLNCTDTSGNPAQKHINFRVPAEDYSSIQSTIMAFLINGYRAVVGSIAPQSDVDSAGNIIESMQNLCHGCSSPEMVNDSGIGSAYTENLLVIGRPQENTITENFIPSSLWPIDENTAVILRHAHNGTATIILAGNTPQDTELASHIELKNLDKECFTINTGDLKIKECSLDMFRDSDNDGISNHADMIDGWPTCNTDFRLLINNTETSTWTGIGLVQIISNNKTVMEFEHDFSEVLDLSSATLGINTATGYGSVVFIGYQHNKTLYVSDINTDMDHVCVKDAELSSISEVSSGCSGTGEILLTCDNSTKSGYSCTKANNTYRIEGLHNSAAREACTDIDGDGYYAEGGACGTADCKDNDKAVYPGAKELDNNKDDDCDGSVDEGVTTHHSSGGGGGSSRRSTSCSEKWVCSDWKDCLPSGIQTRECTDQNNCTTTSSKPNTVMDCEYVEPVTIAQDTNEDKAKEILEESMQPAEEITEDISNEVTEDIPKTDNITSVPFATGMVASGGIGKTAWIGIGIGLVALLSIIGVAYFWNKQQI